MPSYFARDKVGQLIDERLRGEYGSTGVNTAVGQTGRQVRGALASNNASPAMAQRAAGEAMASAGAQANAAELGRRDSLQREAVVLDEQRRREKDQFMQRLLGGGLAAGGAALGMLTPAMAGSDLVSRLTQGMNAGGQAQPQNYNGLQMAAAMHKPETMAGQQAVAGGQQAIQQLVTQSPGRALDTPGGTGAGLGMAAPRPPSTGYQGAQSSNEVFLDPTNQWTGFNPQPQAAPAPQPQPQAPVPNAPVGQLTERQGVMPQGLGQNQPVAQPGPQGMPTNTLTEADRLRLGMVNDPQYYSAMNMLQPISRGLGVPQLQPPQLDLPSLFRLFGGQ